MSTPRSHPGFTLIETMVAITVMTLATLAPLAAMQTVIKATNLSRGQLIAASLAQEGIEYVRFVRYTNYLENGSGYVPLTGLNGAGGAISCLSPKKCTVDAKADPYSGTGTLTGIQKCGGGTGQTTCAPLLRNKTSGIYTQDTTDSDTEATPFTRSITIVDHTSTGNYFTVFVTITWSDHGTRTMTLTEDIYDWL